MPLPSEESSDCYTVQVNYLRNIMQIYVHAHSLSHDNGAVNPISFFFNLAKAVGVEAQTGQHWGDDQLDIPDEDWPVAKELLDEGNMLYRFKLPPGQGQSEWQNVKTNEVRARLGLPLVA
jgi:hypothetical protein